MAGGQVGLEPGRLKARGAPETSERVNICRSASVQGVAPCFLQHEGAQLMKRFFNILAVAMRPVGRGGRRGDQSLPTDGSDAQQTAAECTRLAVEGRPAG